MMFGEEVERQVSMISLGRLDRLRVQGASAHKLS